MASICLEPVRGVPHDCKYVAFAIRQCYHLQCDAEIILDPLPQTQSPCTPIMLAPSTAHPTPATVQNNKTRFKVFMYFTQCSGLQKTTTSMHNLKSMEENVNLFALFCRLKN